MLSYIIIFTFKYVRIFAADFLKAIFNTLSCIRHFVCIVQCIEATGTYKLIR